MDDPQDPEPAPATGEPRPGPACPACGSATRFAGGMSTHDLYAERFVCTSCGRESFRSFGRGSVS